MGLKRLLEKALTGRSKSPPTAAQDGAPGSRYRGVEIHPGEGCCRAVCAIRGQRFLSHEVPALPLADCDAGECACRYELFADRRRTGQRHPDRGGDAADGVSGGRREGDRTG